MGNNAVAALTEELKKAEKDVKNIQKAIKLLSDGPVRRRRRRSSKEVKAAKEKESKTPKPA